MSVTSKKYLLMPCRYGCTEHVDSEDSHVKPGREAIASVVLELAEVVRA